MQPIDHFHATFSQHEDYRESLSTVYTIVVFDWTVGQLIELLEHRIRLVSASHHSKQRSVAMTRLSCFKRILTLEHHDHAVINQVYLIADKVIEIDLMEDWLVVLREYRPLHLQTCGSV